MKKITLFIILFLNTLTVFSQSQKIVMDDVDHFWIAFDSVKIQPNKDKK